MRNRAWTHLCMICLCGMGLSACESPAKQTRAIAPPPVERYADTPQFKPPPSGDVLPDYRLQVGDVLRIRLLLNPELDEDVIVRPDGMISTALVQNMQAYGRTPLELQNALLEFYEAQLKDPKIAVIVQSFAPTRVYVLGEVNAPGEFISVDSNPTVLQAIARAGGILDSANRDIVLVLRRAPGQKEEVFAVRYDDAFYGRDMAQDMRLAAQDIVVVPRSDVANAYHYYREYIQKFLPASLGLGVDLND